MQLGVEIHWRKWPQYQELLRHSPAKERHTIMHQKVVTGSTSKKFTKFNRHSLQPKQREKYDSAWWFQWRPHYYGQRKALTWNKNNSTTYLNKCSSLSTKITVLILTNMAPYACRIHCSFPRFKATKLWHAVYHHQQYEICKAKKKKTLG